MQTHSRVVFSVFNLTKKMKIHINKYTTLTALALFGTVSASHGIQVQVAGMDSNAGNATADTAAAGFDFFTVDSVMLDLNAIGSTTLNGTTVSIGNGVTVDGTGSSFASIQSAPAGLTGQSLASSTSSGSLVFNFSTPTTHFGFYNDDLNTVSAGVTDFFMTFDEGAGDVSIGIDAILGGTGGIGFFGVIFDQAVTTLTLSGNTGDDDYYLDNFVVTAVPEPSTYALMAGLLTFAAVVARRRK
ncbi:MAG: hypothetical protein ACI8Z5_000339 [Lentimonas sp.]|jgi:hypothetical protein